MRIEYSGIFTGEEERSNLLNAVDDMHLTAGKWDKLFVAKLNKYLTVRALTCNSGSSANLLALSATMSPKLARRLAPGDEVITTALAFPTTIAPIFQCGLVPVLVDIDPDTLNIDVTAMKAAWTPKTKAVMIAHTLGVPFDVDSVLDFVRDRTLFLIEDNCDALGAEWRGFKTGGFGHVGTSSFYPAHHITTGEGGAVYTTRTDLFDILASLRDWGRDCWCPPGKDNTCGKRFGHQLGSMPMGYDHKYLYSHLGFNMKMTDFQAAIGAAQIDKAEKFAMRRLQNWRAVREALGIPANHPEHARPSPYAIALWTKSREAVTVKLEEAGIQTRPPFAGNITRQPALAGREFRSTPLPHTDAAMNEVFFVGCHPGIDEEALDYLVENLKGALWTA